MELTRGGITSLFNGQTNLKPVLQVLEMHKVVIKQGNERYKIVVSDGDRLMPAMLVTSLNDLCSNGRVTNFSIIRIEEYTVNKVSDKKLLIVLNLTPLTIVSGKIGNPMSMDGNVEPVAQVAQPASMSSYSNQPQVNPSMAPNNQYNVPVNNMNPYGIKSEPILNQQFTPINQLNPYMSQKWIIKARVTSKSDIRRWNNAKGEGSLFSVNLLDDSGAEIRATFFKEGVDKYFSVLTEGKVYTFSLGSVRMANKRFSTLNNEYDLTFDGRTIVQEVQDDHQILTIKFNFLPIAELPSLPAQSNVDCLGIILDHGSCDEIRTKAGNSLLKRTLKIKDSSNKEINVTIFGDKAKVPDDSFAVDTPICFKGVKTSEYGGCSLTCSFSTEFYTNMDLPEVQSLVNWYATEGRGMVGDSLSSQRASSGGNDIYNIKQRADLADIINKNLGHGDTPDFITVRGTIAFFKVDSTMWYPSCPNTLENGKLCQKKLIEEPGVGWRCERCERTYPSPEYRYVFSSRVSDASSAYWVTFFNDQGNVIFGRPAGEMMQLQQTNPDEFGRAVQSKLFTEYIMKLRVKADMSNGNEYLRAACSAIYPVDYLSESKGLIEFIDSFE
ncbi:hypothetical protein WA158_003093 [Blastocystis sp. Blastoise]